MKKVIFSAIMMAFVLTSCNQKTKEETTVTTVETDTVVHTDTTMTDHSKIDHPKMYACSMHPEVQGKLNDKCSKCGMDLTELVPEK
ncbi:MAG: hypothetical protein M0D53_00855 [Flavobacterium sp. JAD_PAG50586_2]|nr:MAG: hypothetical protein M0D53_00855 [Flavobacterium sp. JAD_PAG50586_2]